LDSLFILTFIRENLLAVIAILITLIFVYHYIIERESGVKLSKKYRDKIFETQSKLFLNASQYLISGNKDLAIKEFLNAVDLNRETMDTYFALGKLFRSNGEIDKAISIHRSIIARENIHESTRLAALKELAIDFDKGGFLDKAIETYKDVLKINRDQFEVILSLCRIFENVGDWDQAYHYRIMLSKVSHENQSETISHILVEKAKVHFKEGDLKACNEDLEDAFRFAPSVSANLLRLKILVYQSKMDQAKNLLIELISEHPMYASFIFLSLEDFEYQDGKQEYLEKFSILKDFYLTLDDENLKIPSIILSKVRLLKGEGKNDQAYEILSSLMKENHKQSDIFNMEYVKILIEVGQKDEALEMTKILLGQLNQSLTRHFCSQCGYDSDQIFWRCPQCHDWETIQFRWKV
jgi:lipopolysaccharide biosynthesis regulator YciM